MDMVRLQQQQTPPAPSHTLKDIVDLRLAESYTPLCICAAKCALVCLLHTTVQEQHQDRAHLACATLLVLDALGVVVPYKVRTVSLVFTRMSVSDVASTMPMCHCIGVQYCCE